MSLDGAITNLASWAGNVMLPTMAGGSDPARRNGLAHGRRGLGDLSGLDLDQEVHRRNGSVDGFRNGAIGRIDGYARAWDLRSLA